MGGLSSFVSANLLNGSDTNLGHVVGEHDAGCASAADVAWAGAKFGGNLALNAIPGGGEARAAEVGGDVALHLAEDGADDVAQNVIRSHRDLVEDFNSNPQDWEMTAAQAGKAINREIKGGINIEGQWRHKITGEELSTHQGLGGPGNETSIHPENDGPNLPGGGSIRPRNQAKGML